MSNMSKSFDIPPEYRKLYGQSYTTQLDVTPWVQSHSSSPQNPHDTSQSIYGTARISLFGTQYGAAVSRAEIPDDTIPPVSRADEKHQVLTFNPYQDMMKNAPPDLQRAATGKAEALWGRARSNSVNVK